ncbi:MULTISPECIES: hypothetical protein [Flavobacteriaceae]|uniref:hypothetical protein n=1 Tax=Flavobacteriaceae TaxID=49546 RepID=UPI00149092C6|nr:MULTISPECIES: hypothetical protein [Allomuricauda]MDC6365191.1 hypothetical protein [Muricauda sp. AC10]
MKPTISFLISTFLVLTLQFVSAQTGSTFAELQDIQSISLNEPIAFVTSENYIDNSLLTNRPINVSALNDISGYNAFENSFGVDTADDFMQNSSSGAADRGFRANFMAGLPTGTESDYFKLKLAVFAYYYMTVFANAQVFGGVGYTQFMGKETNGFKTEDNPFVPFQLGIRYHLVKNFGVWGALGYAIGTNKSYDVNGFIYSLGLFHVINDIFNAIFDYSSISVEGGSFNAISAGVEVNLGF